MRKLLFSIGLALGAPAALAHHSFAVHFVDDRTIEVNGTVSAFRFSNPHGVLSFDVKKDDGTVEQWRAETNSPSVLRRRGWTKDSLKAGDSLRIVGFPSRDGTPYMRISKITFAHGHELIGQGLAAPSPDNDKE
jgi:hypothetical protein